MQGQSAWTQAPYDPNGSETAGPCLSYYDDDGAIRDMPMSGSTVSKTELEAVCDALCAKMCIRDRWSAQRLRKMRIWICAM